MLLIDFQENQFFMIFDPHDVINVTWRRVLRTPLPLLEGVPQVWISLLYEVLGGNMVDGLPPAATVFCPALVREFSIYNGCSPLIFSSAVNTLFMRVCLALDIDGILPHAKGHVQRMISRSH